MEEETLDGVKFLLKQIDDAVTKTRAKYPDLGVLHAQTSVLNPPGFEFTVKVKV